MACPAASRGVFEALPWFQQRLLADHTRAVHMLGAAPCVGNLPSAAEQLDWLRALVLDLYPVSPDEMVFLGLRLIGQEERPDRDEDVAGGTGVVGARVSRRAALPLRLDPGRRRTPGPAGLWNLQTT